MIPDRWVGLLGLVPLALGVRGLVGAIRSRNDDGEDVPAVTAGNAFAVARVTIANGADNIAVWLVPVVFIAIGAVILSDLL